MALRLRTVLAAESSEERVVELPSSLGEIRIGRRQDLELPLPFQSLSSVHARLTADGEGRWSIEDLGSLNGTRLDGVALTAGQRYPLTLGSRIDFGPVAVIFDGPVAADPGTPFSTTDSTATIARRLVNDLFAREPGAGIPTLAVLGGAPTTSLRLDAVDRRYVVGRVEGAALQLVVDEISREHAAFTRSWAGVTVRDLGSKNGIRINGARATEHQLRDGDVVEVGPVALQLTDPADRYLRDLDAHPDPGVEVSIPEIPAAADDAESTSEPTSDPISDPTSEPSFAAPPDHPAGSARTAIITASLVLVAIAAAAIALALSH
jgi:pSer/pThr/pTyr-binding forkhead associated (FHA) protein